MVTKTYFNCGLLLFVQSICSICAEKTIMFPNAQRDAQMANLANNAASKEAFRQISAGSEKFAISLFRRTAETLALASAGSTVNREDFIMSPFSVWSLLTLVAEGADGNTLRELNEALGLSNDLSNVRRAYSTILSALNVKSPAVELSTTQAMFSDVNRPVKNDFSQAIQLNYGAYLDSVDFIDKWAAAQKINQYVKNSTNNRIRQIINQEDLNDSQLMLLSAIYFRGQWKFPFNTSHTKEEPFYDEDGNITGTVEMMTQKNAFAYTAIADLDAHVLELPYGSQDRLSMIMLMPRKGVKLLSMIEKLENVRLERIFNELEKAAKEYEDDEVEVHIPKFTVTTDFNLNSILISMGITEVFEEHANLSKISTSSEIFLSRLIHKAKIEVNEEGTLAVAVTAGLFSNKASPPRFLANRPFMYFIVDKMTNLLLFCGTVKNPVAFKTKS